jgi:hypothetical protein
MDNQKEKSLVYIVQKRKARFIKGSEEFDGSFGPWETYAEAGIFYEIGPAVRCAESQQTYGEIIDKAGADPHGYWWQKTQFRVISAPSNMVKAKITIKGRVNEEKVFGQ